MHTPRSAERPPSPVFDRDLEDWLTGEDDRAVRCAAAAGSVDALSRTDRFTYEVWLLDTEQRNDGVSQYVCN